MAVVADAADVEISVLVVLDVAQVALVHVLVVLAHVLVVVLDVVLALVHVLLTALLTVELHVAASVLVLHQRQSILIN